MQLGLPLHAASLGLPGMFIEPLLLLLLLLLPDAVILSDKLLLPAQLKMPFR
jgi:hypothetical protein